MKATGQASPQHSKWHWPMFQALPWQRWPTDTRGLQGRTGLKPHLAPPLQMLGWHLGRQQVTFSKRLMKSRLSPTFSPRGGGSSLMGRLEILSNPYTQWGTNGVSFKLFHETYALLLKYMQHSKEFPRWRSPQWQLTTAGDVGDMGLIPELGRSPGVGNGNPLQYSYLENSLDRGA